MKRETLAAQSMNGMLASGTRVTRTIPAGTIGNSQAIETVRETWMADDLKVPLMTKTYRSAHGNHDDGVDQRQSQPAGCRRSSRFPADYTVKKGPGGPGGRGTASHAEAVTTGSTAP